MASRCTPSDGAKFVRSMSPGSACGTGAVETGGCAGSAAATSKQSDHRRHVDGHTPGTRHSKFRDPFLEFGAQDQ